MSTSTEKAPAYEQISESAPPPVYGSDFSAAYKQWKHATESARQLDDLLDRLPIEQKKLDSASTELKKLKEKSSALFEALHSKKNRLSLILSSKAEKQKEAEKREATKTDFERAHAEETKEATVVDGLNGKVSQIKKEISTLRPIASSSDDAWNILRQTPEASTPALSSLASAIGSAFESEASAESSLTLASKSTEDLTRARLTIQHAHKYFSLALRVCDELNPASKGSSLTEGMGGDLVMMSKQNDYKDAIKQADKAQVCLDDCFRVLEPHLDTLPEDRVADYNELKKSGLKQISRIHDYMYNGAPVDGSIRKLVQQLVEKQEAAFKHLTQLAIWIQEYVPQCESDERQARRQRDEARGKLAEIWKQNQRSQ